MKIIQLKLKVKKKVTDMILDSAVGSAVFNGKNVRSDDFDERAPIVLLRVDHQTLSHLE
jgi:hypothetical protein